MLIPAILKKDEIIQNFRKIQYTEEMLLISGTLDNICPDIEDSPKNYIYQFAIINNNDELIGYISYVVDLYLSSASHFLLISFNKDKQKCNFITSAIIETFKKLINEYNIHRIEWRMIGGNPIEKHYDNICKKYKGNKLCFRDAIKDRTGKYRNLYVYEIITTDNMKEK